MALDEETVYMIRNKLTGTVLDITNNQARNVFVMGWVWHGEINQQWQLIHVEDDKWKIHSRRAPDRFLCPRMEDGHPNDDEHYRIAGGIAAYDFELAHVEGTQYRILFNDNLAVTLVTGQGVYNIQERDRVPDLHADGAPIALQTIEFNDQASNYRAQLWSFEDADESAVTQALVNNRAYKIVNYKTGTVLDMAATAGNPVLGLVSKGGDEHKWTVRAGDQDRYRFESSTVENRFLAPDVDENDPGNGTFLIGRPEGQATLFTVRNVPGTLLYKIFFDPQAATESVSGLAVNLAVVDGTPDSLDGAVVSLQAAEAQTWYFLQ